jgi:hypothetical protein
MAHILTELGVGYRLQLSPEQRARAAGVDRPQTALPNL